MKWRLSKYVLVPSFALITIILLFKPLEVFAASSPSFGYEKIQDALIDIVDIQCLKDTQGTNISKCTGMNNAKADNQSIDIAEVDYSSDGKTLNATIWLISDLNESISKNVTSYGMYLDADSNSLTGSNGIDYQLEISQENGKWTEILYHFSSYNGTEILYHFSFPDKIINLTKTETYTAFLGKYIPLSIDLNGKGLLNEYKIMFYSEVDFYSEVYNKNLPSMMDFTSWSNIPPPQYSLLTSPTNINLRPGESKPISVQLTSNTGLVPTKIVKKNSSTNLELNFMPNEQKRSAYSIEPTSIEIKIPKKATPGLYTKPILVNISKTSTIQPYPYLNEGYELKELNLPVTVLNEMTLGEWLNDINQTYISPLNAIYTFIGGLFTGGISRLLFNKITGKNKNNDEKNGKC